MLLPRVPGRVSWRVALPGFVKAIAPAVRETLLCTLPIGTSASSVAPCLSQYIQLEHQRADI